MITGISFVLYILSLIICILYVRYDKESTDTDRKIVLGMMWIPFVNIGYALCVIADILVHLSTLEKLYRFIRYGKNS